MSLKNFKSIGDSLSTNEFNGLISLYRHFKVHQDSIRINDEVNTDFGKYEFDIEDTTILDTGILITDETISAEPKVKLSNALFSNSTYTLVLEVLHYIGVNILDDVTPSNFKVVDTLEVELLPNEWVDIPVTDLEEDYIISFDATVKITHDKTVIQGTWINTIALTTNKNRIHTSETLNLTATVTDSNGTPVPNKTISFYKVV